MTEAVPLDRLLYALADPYRRQCVELLARGPASVKELAEPTDRQLPAVLKQLRVLEEGGIVVSEKAGRIRTYRLRADALAPVGDWIEQRRRDMDQAFDRLAHLMAEIPEQKDH